MLLLNPAGLHFLFWLYQLHFPPTHEHFSSEEGMSLREQISFRLCEWGDLFSMLFIFALTAELIFGIMQWSLDSITG